MTTHSTCSFFFHLTSFQSSPHQTVKPPICYINKYPHSATSSPISLHAHFQNPLSISHPTHFVISQSHYSSTASYNSRESSSSMANDHDEILLLPFFGQGHLFPCIELCKHLSKRNYKITLIISSSLTSSIPSSLTIDYPLIQIAELQSSDSNAPPSPPPEQGPPPPPMTGPPTGGFDPFRKRHQEMEHGIETLLSTRRRPQGSKRPVCAVIDVMMSRAKPSFAKFGVPTVSFFTSGACSASMEYAMWKERVSELKPGEVRALHGLPDEMSVSYEEVNTGPRDMPPGGGPPPGGPGFPMGGPPPSGPGFPPTTDMPPTGAAAGPPWKVKGGGGPPRPGGQPMWLEEIEGSIAILMNTCSELEGLFLNYVAGQLGIPVWGVGPLLPEQYWRSAGSILHDRDIRPKKNSSHSEEEVIQWLDSKPGRSVLYVSFGSEVGPNKEELVELASALEETKTPFIWVVRPGSGRPGPPGSGGDQEGYYPHGLAEKVGDRGLIIHGWAPQLLILSHPSTGGFLSHCGWNSTAEAIGRGVPFLAWPIRGDQFYNAKMVAKHLRIGYLVKETGLAEMVRKDDILGGIEKLMGDVEVTRRADLLKGRLESGFPKSSEEALDAFGEFLGAKEQNE